MRPGPPLFLVLALLAAAPPAGAQPTEKPSEAAADELLRAVDLGGLEARSAALILSGEEGGELDISVLAIPLRGGPEQVWVGLVIDVWDVAELPDAGEPLLTEVYAYALDERQEIAAFLTQAFAVDPAERRGVKFFGHLDLVPGEYSLRVLVLRRATGRLGLRVLPLAVPPWTADFPLPPLAADDPGRWVLVREEGVSEPAFPLIVDGRPVVPATREPPTSSTSSTPPTPSTLPFRRSRLVTAYAEALRRLAAGDRAAAGAALVELERSALGRGGRGVEEALAERLLAFAARLAAVDSDSLVPLIQLHEALYREHHRQGRFQLATHSRRMVTGLAEIYAGGSATADSRRLAAGALASLGGYLQELGAMPAAEAAFERAVEYDAADAAALLGLASIHEAYGAHHEAAGLLKRLLEAHPGHAEARLRRAVCLERLGATREAAALYRDGLGTGADWMRAVAYQELADLYVAEKRHREAVALLGEALERLPEFQRFHLQLAAVFDRMQRPAEARAALARLDPRAGREADSPRLTYSRWPAWTIAKSRRVLEEAAAARLEVLAAALAQDSAAEEKN